MTATLLRRAFVQSLSLDFLALLFLLHPSSSNRYTHPTYTSGALDQKLTSNLTADEIVSDRSERLVLSELHDSPLSRGFSGRAVLRAQSGMSEASSTPIACYHLLDALGNNSDTGLNSVRCSRWGCHGGLVLGSSMSGNSLSSRKLALLRLYVGFHMTDFCTRTCSRRYVFVDEMPIYSLL